jgi:hypothetical protein
MNRIIGVLAVLLMSGIGFAGLTITDYSVSQDAYSPGSQGTVTLYVSNPSACPSLPSGCEEDHRLTEVGASISSPSQITMSERVDAGDLSIGASTFITVPFTVSDTAKSGVYSITFRIFSFAQTAQTRYITIPITVADVPEFVFTPDTNVLTSVDVINMDIKNNGGIAKGLKIKVGEDPSKLRITEEGSNDTRETEMYGFISGVTLYGTNEIYVGDLTDEKTVTMMLDSRSAEDGPVDIPFILTYQDEIGVLHEEIDYVRMTVKKEKLDVIFDQKSDVITRQESTLLLALKNNGDENIEDVKLSFSDENMRLRDGSEFDFGDVGKGGEATVSGTVFATLSPGLNLIPAKITWIENDVNKEQEITVPLTISSDADVGVYIETKPAPLTVGQEHTLSVLVSNLGSYRIDNVDVEIDSDVLQSLDITNKQYIGSLENDDFSTVQFKTQISSSTAPGDYDMTVKITYRDQSGEWKTRYISQPLIIYGMQAEEGGVLNYVIILVVLAVVVWFFFLRKKKKEA